MYGLDLNLSLAKIPSGPNDGLVLNWAVVSDVPFGLGSQGIETTNRHERKVEWAAIARLAQLSSSSSSLLRKDIRSGSGGQIVAMMQTAEPRH
jgi:hypothetical protein